MRHKPSCCIKCHLKWVEKDMLPRLPDDVQREIFLEHQTLRSAGTSRHMIASQGERALVWYEVYCTPEQLHRYRVDQTHLQKGKTS